MREVARKRIAILPLAVLVIGSLLLLIVPSGKGDGLQQEIVAASYIYRLALAVAVIAAGAGAIAEEVESGTVLLLAMRPIRRRSIVFGKLLGIAAMTLAALLAWSVVGGLALWVRSGDSMAITGMLRVGIAGLLPELLMLVVAVALSTIMSARNAIVLTILAWLAALGAATTAEVLDSDSTPDGLDSYRWIGKLARAVTWVVPRSKLENFANQSVGKVADSISDTAHVGVGAMLGGVIAIVAWGALAALAFERRRSLT
jgi:ABC-type transport system involved in multi-copper enzyme maturation permease subunit